MVYTAIPHLIVLVKLLQGILLPKEEGKRGYKKVAARVLLWMGWSGTSRTSEMGGKGLETETRARRAHGT